MAAALDLILLKNIEPKIENILFILNILIQQTLLLVFDTR